MTTHIGRRSVLAAALLAALSATAAFLLLGGHGGNAGAASGRAQAASADVIAHFSVLSRPLTGSPADTIGSYVEANTLAGFNPDLARRVSPDPRSRMWVAPADGDAICRVDAPITAPHATPVAHCHTLADTLAGKSVAVAGSAPEVEIRGLVPDGVQRVLVHLVGGSTATAPVRDNAYDLIVDKATVSITYTDGVSTTDVSAPSIDGPAAKG